MNNNGLIEAGALTGSFCLDGLIDVSRPGGEGGTIGITTTRRHEGMAGVLND